MKNLFSLFQIPHNVYHPGWINCQVMWHVLTVIFFNSSFGKQLDIKCNHSSEWDGQPSGSDWSISCGPTNERGGRERWSQVAGVGAYSVTSCLEHSSVSTALSVISRSLSCGLERMIAARAATIISLSTQVCGHSSSHHKIFSIIASNIFHIA